MIKLPLCMFTSENCSLQLYEGVKGRGSHKTGEKLALLVLKGSQKSAILHSLTTPLYLPSKTRHRASHHVSAQEGCFSPLSTQLTITSGQAQFNF